MLLGKTMPRRDARAMRRSLAPWSLALTSTLVSCGGTLTGSDAGRDATRDAGALDATATPLEAGIDAASSPDDGGQGEDTRALDAAAAEPCTTRITYGGAWIHGPDHPLDHDDAAGLVTWDGACVDEGSNSYAVLSNGWRPDFSGRSACVIALDRRGACEPPPGPCATRITYGARWLHPDTHPAQHDDVAGVVSWEWSVRGRRRGLTHDAVEWVVTTLLRRGRLCALAALRGLRRSLREPRDRRGLPGSGRRA
jgi:hypothetical protein